jgi:hypothetical protein
MWFYYSNDERKGPVSTATIRSLYATRQVTAETMVWQQGMPEWKPVRETALAADLEIPLPEGDQWLTCAYSGERGKQSAMVPLDGYFILAEHKDSAVDFIKQGGTLPKVELSERADGNTELAHLFRSAWALVQQDGLKLALLYLALWIPGNLLSNWMDTHVLDPDKPMQSLQFYRLLYNIIGTFFAGSCLHVFWLRANGRTGPIPDWLTAGFANWGRLFVAGLLVGILTVVGFILLIIPGLIVMVRTSLASVMAVGQRLGGSAAVQASWDISKGRFWQLTGYTLLVSTLFAIPLMAFESLMIMLPQFDEWISHSVLQTVLEVGEIYVFAFLVCYVREASAQKRS